MQTASMSTEQDFKVRIFRIFIIVLCCMFAFCSNASAGIKRIVLASHDLDKWQMINIKRLGIDDKGNVYVLQEREIQVFDETGKNMYKISLSDDIHEGVKWNSIVVFGKPHKILLQGYGTGSFERSNLEEARRSFFKKILLNADGTLNRRLKSYAVTARKKTCFDYFINQYNEPLDLLGVYKNTLHSFEDSNRNYYDRTKNELTNEVSLLQKKNQDDNIIWEIDFNEYIEIIGIDSNDNIYIKRDDYKVFRLNQHGEVTGFIDAGESTFFPFPFSEQDEFILKYHFGSEEPLHDTILSCSGDIFVTYSFSQLPPDAKKLFQKNGEYFITKIAWEKSPSSLKGNHFKQTVGYLMSKEYDGDSILYSKWDLFMNKGVVSVLSKSNLRIIRNEIYARKGRTFKSQDLKQIFESCDWYKPDPNYSDDMLNDIERRNIQFILDYENNMGWR